MALAVQELGRGAGVVRPVDRKPAFWRVASLFRWSRKRAPLPEAVYRDLIDMLFSMSLPVFGLGLCYVVVGWLIAATWNDEVIGWLTAAAALVTLLRLVTIYAYRRDENPRTYLELRRWERFYAVGSLAFALLLGLLNVRVLTYHYPLMHMITVSLVFGFGAGIVSRISYRPLICVGSLALCVVPTVIALAAHGVQPHEDPMHGELFVIEALVVAIIALLSLNTVRFLYRTVILSLTTRHEFAKLAKNDDLTGLPNRLLLRERFQHSIQPVERSGRLLALHFLDLDGFKAINDLFGHPAGDALLCEVARRLTRMVRAEDTVARLGGDEFVIVQAAIEHRGEAEMLARRIIRQLSMPYEIEGKTMRISASIGIALAPEQGVDFERLSACADLALYRSKGDGKGRLHFCTDEEARRAVSAVA